jgi:hypothetical protein
MASTMYAREAVEAKWQAVMLVWSSHWRAEDQSESGKSLARMTEFGYQNLIVCVQESVCICCVNLS